MSWIVCAFKDLPVVTKNAHPQICPPSTAEFPPPSPRSEALEKSRPSSEPSNQVPPNGVSIFGDLKFKSTK